MYELITILSFLLTKCSHRTKSAVLNCIPINFQLFRETISDIQVNMIFFKI